MAGIHGSQTNVQGAFGDQNDLMYRFGSDGTTPGNGILGGPLTVGHASSGPRLDFSFTAAQAQTLTTFSLNLFNNSADATSYGVRDTGLFVQIAGGRFFQFGDLFTSPADNANQGTVVFSDNFAVATPAGFADDADNDGMDNGLEFVLGGNPLVSDFSILPMSTVGAANVTVAYTRSADSVGSTTQAV